jgi:FkbM family methyltransferase
MKKMVINMIQNLVREFGYEINNYKNQEKRKAEKLTWLQNLDIETVIDIGACTGQFAKFIMNIFPKANLFAFEPLESEYSKMNLNLGNNPKFRAFNIGLGDINGSTDFFINSVSPSSSLLPMENLHKKLYPLTAEQTKCVIKISRLDDFIGEGNLQIKPNLLIKMDVQGAENKVIEGGIGTFRQAKVVISEVSYFNFYKGQPLAKDIINLLSELGFVYCGVFEQFKTEKDNLPLFADVFFIKQDLISSILSIATKDNSA